MSLSGQEIKVFTLSDIAAQVKLLLADRFANDFWVQAEMNKLNHYIHSGHCYPELLEKKGNKVIAQFKANLWRDDYQRVNRKFLTVLKEPLKDGITILFLARISFDAVYGLSLRILDIDPSYSLGELEREKQETITRLRQEQIFSRNRSLQPALLLRRIAVISVETSKGYADFRQIIDGNPWGYHIFYMLFPSLLQGDNLTVSIGGQLERIRNVIRHFDAVAIIRGGGGDIGLSGYNHYELARQIALFPLPVITGIGHATNETVAEMVAFRNCITPTDLAGFLIQQYHNFAVPVKEAVQRLGLHTSALILTQKAFLQEKAFSLGRCLQINLTRERKTLSRLHYRICIAVSDLTISGRQAVWRLYHAMKHAISTDLREKQHTLESIEKQTALLDPVHVLSRGYSVTLLNGTPVTGISSVSVGDTVKTILFSGELKSEVKEVLSSEQSNHE